MLTVKNSWGTEIDFDYAVILMDEELRQKLDFELSPCSVEEFFEAYCKAHVAKYNEEFECSKKNPCI